jgi:hypothetical protein
MLLLKMALILLSYHTCGKRLLEVGNISYGEAVLLANEWQSLENTLIALEKQKKASTYHVWGDIFARLKK